MAETCEVIDPSLFDTAAPPSYAREMFNHFIVAINQLNCQLILLGGNHDSVAMLNESKRLLACLNVHVVAQCNDVDQQVLTIKNEKLS